MKSIISVLLVLAFVSTAYAVNYSGEEMVSPISTYQANQIEIDQLAREVKSLKANQSKRLKSLEKEAVENRKATVGLTEVTKEQVQVTRRSVEAIENVGKDVNSVGADVKGLKFWVLGVGALGLIMGIIILIAMWRDQKNKKKRFKILDNKLENLGCNVEEIPERTATKIRRLDPIVIELNNVHGKNVKFTADVVDGEYLSAYVPSYVTAAAADPSKIERARYSDRGDLRKSTASAMKWYFAMTAQGAPAANSERDKQQLALIEYLKKSGKLIIG